MKKNFKIEFSSFMTKKEREILKQVLDNYLFNKELNFNIVNLDIPKMKNDEVNFFERFAKKGFWLIEGEERSYINYFSSINIKKEQIRFKLNGLFIKLIEERKLVNSYSLYNFLFLKHKLSVDFFFIYMIENLQNSVIEIPLLELKFQLKVENYTRMYDLDRYVLQLIEEDINKNTQFTLSYEKIKVSGRVEKIRFYIKSKEDIEAKANIKMLLFLFKRYIRDQKRFVFLIEEQLKVKSYSKIKKMIVTAINLLPKFNYSFEDSLAFLIENGYISEYILVKRNKYRYESNYDILKYIFKDIQFYLKDDDEIFTHIFSDKLIKKVYNIVEDVKCTVKTERSKLEIWYSKDMFYMDIYSKKEIFKIENQ